MKLPHPFQSATDVKPNAEGSIDLIDAQGKSLARVPLATAFELSPETEGGSGCSGYGNGSGRGYGYGNGSGYGDGYDDGRGYGDEQSEGDGGRSK